MNVLKAFLIELGFRVDAPGLRTFNAAVSGTSGAVFGLAKAAATTAAAVEGMVLAVAYQMSKLNYASQLAHTSAENLLSFQFGMEQIGLSAEQATAAVTGMAMAVQKNPGLVAVFEKLTGKALDQDFVKNLHALVDSLAPAMRAGGPRATQALQQAGLFGLDQVTLNKMVMGRDREREEEARRARYNRLAGVDTNKLATESTELVRQLNDLWAIMKTLGAGISEKLIGPLTGFLKVVEKAGEGVLGGFGMYKSGQDLTDEQRKNMTAGQTVGYMMAHAADSPTGFFKDEVIGGFERLGAASQSELDAQAADHAFRRALVSQRLQDWNVPAAAAAGAGGGTQSFQEINLNFFGPTDPTQLEKALRDSTYYFQKQGQ